MNEEHEFYPEGLVQVSLPEGLVDIYFNKEGGKWYATVFRYTNEVIMPGADAILDSIYNDIHRYDNKPPSSKEFFVTVDLFGPRRINESPFGIMDFTRVSHDEGGATYRITGSLAEELGINEQTIHLGNLVHTILDGHPLRISLAQRPFF